MVVIIIECNLQLMYKNIIVGNCNQLYIHCKLFLQSLDCN